MSHYRRRIRRINPANIQPGRLLTNSGYLEYSLIRSSYRRTIEISVTENADVRVSAPRYSPDQDIQRFIHDKTDWIQKKIHQMKDSLQRRQRRQYDDGEIFLFLGERYSLSVIEEPKRRRADVSLAGDRLCVKVPVFQKGEGLRKFVKEKLTEWYRREAMEIFGGRVFQYSRSMGLEPKKIAVRTQKRIWGSCHHKNRSVNLNWLLVLAPLPVIDYVIVHELCHLNVPNHSRKFWNQVEKILPDYKERQNWLKRHQPEMAMP